MLTTAVFELGQHFMLQKLVMKPMLALISISRQNKDNCFG